MKYLYIGVGILIVVVGLLAVVKKVSPASWGWWGTTNTSSGIALHGHDPVAYFDNSTATKGDSDFVHEWSDATWQFSSEDNRARFAADPEQYAPQFGSFCAFAMSKGFTAEIDPDAWHLEDGQLFVFADQNVRDDWVAALPEGSLESSRASWAKR